MNQSTSVTRYDMVNLNLNSHSPSLLQENHWMLNYFRIKTQSRLLTEIWWRRYVDANLLHLTFLKSINLWPYQTMDKPASSVESLSPLFYEFSPFHYPQLRRIKPKYFCGLKIFLDWAIQRVIKLCKCWHMNILSFIQFMFDKEKLFCR